ncbi:uncharacterized protein LOC141885604 isoform X1 [Acropora palmata]|uniref:uncharacterized protein LOC141885604 isoform X1 n=1 Tax=Acropora palmata TaxID=6131 RepID=UPI003DA1263E
MYQRKLARGRGGRDRGKRGRPVERANGRGRGRERAVSEGLILPDIMYKWNQLYVLGLHYKTSPDGLKNYIHLISGYEVLHVLWFKPNGKAIVTLKTRKIKDFQDILKGQERRPTLDGVKVLIERAPQCNSIFVSDFAPDTSQDEVQLYFENTVGPLDKARGIKFSPQWEGQDEKCRFKRAIVYFENAESVRKAVNTDHFLGGNALHVEQFYPFMGTVMPLDKPRNFESTGLPEFRHLVDPDSMGFIMESNQAMKLNGDLRKLAKAQITWIAGRTYVRIMYAETKVDKEFEERAWQQRCRKIVDGVLESCTSKEFQIDEEILDEVNNQLQQIQRQVLSIYTAKVKLVKQTLKLICLKSNIDEFAAKLSGRLKIIEQEEREKKLEEKKMTDISSEVLQLLQYAKIEKILREEFVTESIRALVQWDNHALVLKTPKGLMDEVHRYLRQRLDEIDKYAIDCPAKILEILKRGPGKKKMAKELPEGCSFNVDDKKKRVIFLGGKLSKTEEGNEKAKDVLVSDRNLKLTAKDNSLLGSQPDKWNDFCKKLEKRHMIRQERELECIAVFGFKENVLEAVKKIRDFLNETKATKGEFFLDLPLHRRFFGEFYKEEVQALEQELEHFGVQICFNESGDIIHFSGSEEGVKEVEERLYVMQDAIKKKTFKIRTPGMKKLFTQEEGDRLIEKIQREKKCSIEVIELSIKGEKEEHDDESESDDSSSKCNDEEAIDENDNTIFTPQGKKVTWKTGEIQEEQADVLVCSVGSDLMLSHGAIATAMSKAAGPKLQDALREAANGLQSTDLFCEGDIIPTGPGKLPCRHVIHCVCCPWNGETDREKGVRFFSSQIMKKLLMKCFDKASELGACSIGLPLIGTGTLQFPYAVAVQIMVEAAVEHSQGNPESSLEEFRFIVFNDDQKGIASFEDKFTEFKEKQQPTELEAIRKETDASGSSKENEVDSTRELITCSLPQNVIIHGRKESLDEAMSALEDETKKACNEPSEVKHDVLGRLSKRCLKRLKQKSHSLDVKLEQPESRCIRLEGLPKDVMNVSKEITSFIMEQLEREYDEDKAEQMFRTVRWNMISTSGNEKPFDKIANLEIETAYKAKQPSVLFTHQNQKAEINFDTNEVTFLKNGRKKRVRRKDVFPLPDVWDPQPHDENDKEESVYLASLPEESKEYKRVQEKFLKSLRKTVNIIKIERIQNPLLHSLYMMRKQSMDEKNGSLENERELFHGTRYESVKSINMQGFNRSLCGQNAAAYGDGVYFAEDAYYSRSFSKPADVNGECYMYLAKVLVGKYTKGMNGIKIPPPRDKCHPEVLFDSVVDDPDNPSIFVIFGDCDVYPEYLITFK